MLPLPSLLPPVLLLPMYACPLAVMKTVTQIWVESVAHQIFSASFTASAVLAVAPLAVAGLGPRSGVANPNRRMNLWQLFAQYVVMVAMMPLTKHPTTWMTT